MGQRADIVEVHFARHFFASLRHLLPETPLLLLRIVQLGEGIAQLHARDIDLEALDQRRIVRRGIWTAAKCPSENRRAASAESACGSATVSNSSPVSSPSVMCFDAEQRPRSPPRGDCTRCDPCVVTLGGGARPAGLRQFGQCRRRPGSAGQYSPMASRIESRCHLPEVQTGARHKAPPCRAANLVRQRGEQLLGQEPSGRGNRYRPGRTRAW